MKMLDHPKVTVPIYDIIIDPRINTRELDEDVIEEYREPMREYGKEYWQSFWNEYPRMTESRHLYSGSHTVTAAMREFGREYQISVVQEGKDWREAYFLATRMNATHGRRRTNAEKELAVRRWLEDDEMCQWTDGHIAKECLVSAPFVSKVARSLETISSRPTKRKYLDEKGEVQWKETKQIGTNQTKDSQETERESETEDYEYKNAYDFAVAKSDEAIRTYEEKQESLGLAELPWYGADGFFYHAQAEFERQGKQLGYAHRDLSINQLSELAKLWESVTNAIKHNANWVKAVVRQEEQKTERERQDTIKTCRKLVKEAKQRFHVVREELGFPDMEWEHFISSYAQKQFEDPLFPHVFEIGPLDELKDRCRVWASIKDALSSARPVAWVQAIAQQHNKVDVQPNKGSELDGTDDFGFSKIIEANKQNPEYLKVYEEAVAAVQVAKDTYNAVKRELGFTGLPWHRPNQPTLEKECFRAYAIMEGKMLTLVDPAMDTAIDFQKRLVNVWQTLKQDLETPADWVKTAAWQYKASLLEAKEEIEEDVSLTRDQFKEKTEELREDLGQGTTNQSPNEFFQKAVDSVEENEEAKRTTLMEEIGALHDGLEALIGVLSEEAQVEIKQFLKVNYDAYPTYSWRDRLKIEALETLRDTLNQIGHDITEKGLDWFRPADTPEPEKDAEPHEGYKIALEKATKAMDQAEQTYAICQSKLGLDELPWRGHIGPCFWNYAQDAFGVTGIEDGQLPKLVEPSDSMRFDRLTELANLWARVELAIKLPGDWVKALKPDLDGLKTAMRQRIKDLRRFVGSGLNLATLYHTTPEKVIEIRDSLLAESEPEQPTELQIEPVGPSGSTPEAKVDTGGETTSKPFTELDRNYKVYVRFAMDKVQVLTEIDDLPDAIITLSEELYKALRDYAPDYSVDAGGE